MHTVIRTYSGKNAVETIDLIIASKRDVKKMMRGVKGFISYSIIKTDTGGFTVTVAKNEKASEAITAAAREWVTKNAAHLKPKAPKIVGGTVALHIDD